MKLSDALRRGNNAELPKIMRHSIYDDADKQKRGPDAATVRRLIRKQDEKRMAEDAKEIHITEVSALLRSA